MFQACPSGTAGSGQLEEAFLARLLSPESRPSFWNPQHPGLPTIHTAPLGCLPYTQPPWAARHTHGPPRLPAIHTARREGCVTWSRGPVTWGPVTWGPVTRGPVTRGPSAPAWEEGLGINICEPIPKCPAFQKKRDYALQEE